MVKTTVVIPNYNGIQFIDKCLSSVLIQDTEVEVIVVDNGSTDQSNEIVKQKYPQVKLICLESNTGFCHASNAGIKEATTPYIFLLNNDTTLMSDTVSKLEMAMEQKKDAFAMQSKMVSMNNPDIIDSAGDLYCALGWAFAIGKDKKSSDYSEGIHKVTSACGGAVMLRREIIQKIGLLDENHFAYLEDVDWGLRAYINGYNSYVCYDAVTNHYGSGMSGSRYNEFKVKLSAKNSVYIIYKNLPIGQVIFNLPFILIGYLIKLAFFARKGLGSTYFNGILKGLDMCSDDKCRLHKVHFKASNLARYIRLEAMLLINVLRRFG